jgi:hypothetical protein
MISENKFTQSALPRTALETLCLSLSQGLHATAQPLSILRAGLGNPSLDEMSIEQLRELTSASAIEVERVCTLFSYLRQLVSAESFRPPLSATPILPLLVEAADGLDLLFRKDGMCLRSTFPKTCQLVLINRATTLQVLSNVLLIAHSVSRPEDTVELVASSDSSNSVRVVVRNLKSRVEGLNAEGSLSMALAEATARSQQFTLSWSLQPFAVQIGIPMAPMVGSW